MSTKWFTEFYRDLDISLQWKMHAAQKAPEKLKQQTENFKLGLLLRENMVPTYLRICCTWIRRYYLLVLAIIKLTERK